MEQHQKQHGYSSLRGGLANVFYIHIQNYRKENRWVWHTIQQAVNKGFIPKIQIGKPEVAGNIFDWCLPKRSEELIVILYFDSDDRVTLHQTMLTISNQDYSHAGFVIINNSGNYEFIKHFIDERWPYLHRSTFINFEQKVAYNEAIYKAIHYYLTNPESFICMMQQGDVLLYPGVLSECMNRLHIYKADVLVGKEISDHTLIHAGMSRSNFLHPRMEPDSLMNGLAIFRKYLFDAISQLDLKCRRSNAPAHIPAFSKIIQSHYWMNDLTNISILIPIIELSTNPIRFDHFNVLRSRDISSAEIHSAKEYVQKNSPKKEGEWEMGHKTFRPNQQKIELDITYECNLKCFHCNRSCTQAPSKEHMTIEQVREFIKESITMKKSWQLINVLGGEPTLHPDFEKIVHALLFDYIDSYSNDTTLQITSNGYGEFVRQKLEALPKHPNLVIDTHSFKNDRLVPYFTPFNQAPVDDHNIDQHEYHKGCWVTSYCGLGLNHLGYFACGVAGGIERVIKTEKGISSLSNVNENLLKHQLELYCRLCGNFTAYARNRGDFMERAEKDSAPKTAISDTWKKIYNKFNNESI